MSYKKITKEDLNKKLEGMKLYSYKCAFDSLTCDDYYKSLKKESIYDTIVKTKNKNKTKDKSTDNLKLTESEENISKYINKYYKILDEEEKKHILLKIITPEKIAHELLSYELKYYQGFRVKNFIYFIDFARLTFDKFHMRVGGYLCEDTKWTFHNSLSTKYPLKSSEVLFENSLKRIYRNDVTTNIYFHDIESYLVRHKPNDVDVLFRLIKGQDDIFWVFYKIFKN